MAAPWSHDEMAGVDWHDPRLDRRLLDILSSLADRPNASIPAACGGHAEMTAAYRFFDNDRVRAESILVPHRTRTHQRRAAQAVVVLVPDTTELDLTWPQQPVQGAGRLATPSRQGVFLHLMAAFTPDGTPLGVVASKTWTRARATLTVSAADRRKKRKQLPLSAKESVRWLESLQQARSLAADCPNTTCVLAADSASDIYEVLAEARGATNPLEWVIRLSQDRATVAAEAAAEAATPRLRECVQATAVLETKTIPVRGRSAKVSCETRRRRQPRTDRLATVEVRAATVTLRPPHRSDRQLPEITVNVVLVREVNPPAGDVAVEWLLMTSLPIADITAVRTVIAYDTVRWMIEVFFRTLKSGCRVEERRFEQVDRVLVCLAVYLIVAWRVLYVCRLGRSHPELNCASVFEPSEWMAVWLAVEKTQPPAAPPALATLVRMVAQLGGYVYRPKRADPPGPQTVWLGMQRMQDLALAWDLFGPGARRKDV